MTAWDPGFIERSPMLEALREPARALQAHAAWPRREALQALLDACGTSNAAGVRIRLVEEKWGQTRFSQRVPASARNIESAPTLSYEERIRLNGEMPFRECGWHDLLNVLAWLAYPAAKTALNDVHCAAMAGGSGRAAQRGRRRDALTLFDESGAIVLSSDASLLEDLRAFRWKRLFVERRAEVLAAMRFHVLGHAVFEKALQPYVGMTAHAVLLEVGAEVVAQPLAQRLATADALAARAVRTLCAPRELAPLPVLGVPGWWSDNENTAFYDNAAYFRSGRRGT